MERQLLERMIGAAVLLVALVVIVPAVLDGRPDADDALRASAPLADPPTPEAPMRQVTIRPDRPADSPPIATEATAVAGPAEQAVAKPAAEPAQPATESKPKIVAEVPQKSPAKSEAAASPKTVAKPGPTAAPKTEPAPAKTRTAAAPEKQPEPKPTPEVKVASAPSALLAAGWVVQLGSFSSRTNAQGLADQTRAKGFKSYLMPIERSGKTLYRVRVGPPKKTRDEAAKLAGQLQKAGFKGQVAEQDAVG
ncbi:MAG: SPOR domain-containing protein [Gammaproteobacteria bacterium]